MVSALGEMKSSTSTEIRKMSSEIQQLKLEQVPPPFHFTTIVAISPDYYCHSFLAGAAALPHLF
jgi:hypothetical protein